MAGPVTMAVLGGGARGTTYAGFARDFAGRARVVALAEPRAGRREALADDLGLPADRRFGHWRELAARPRLADAVIVATPDREHVGPATAFAGLGYHVLLEKPIAPAWDECVAVVEAAERAGVILAVCHVMRYTPYTEAVQRTWPAGPWARWWASSTWSLSAGGTSRTPMCAATGAARTARGPAC
jgi:predicted dehydrogenase